MFTKAYGLKVWRHVFLVWALLLGMGIFAGSNSATALAGKLTDTGAGIGRQTPAATGSGVDASDRPGSFSARDLSKLTRMERLASATAKAAPGRTSDDAFIYFSDPSTAGFPGEDLCAAGPPCQILGVDGTVPKAIEMWVNPGQHTNLN